MFSPEVCTAMQVGGSEKDKWYKQKAIAVGSIFYSHLWL